MSTRQNIRFSLELPSHFLIGSKYTMLFEMTEGPTDGFRTHLWVMRYCLGWAPWVWGIWGEWLFIFRELESTGNYFQGFGEQAHSFGDLGSPAKK